MVAELNNFDFTSHIGILNSGTPVYSKVNSSNISELKLLDICFKIYIPNVQCQCSIPALNVWAAQA